jgi:uncharacterized protein
MKDIQPVGEADKKARTWGSVCHLSALLGLLGIPFGNLLGPLVAWLILRHQHPFIDAQGKEALNFQISMVIYAFIAFTLIFLMGHLLIFALLAVDLIFVVIAAVKSSSGESYRYPIAIRLIK